MSVPREVVLDLLPLYVAGEASPASRALVEEYLQGDAELAARVKAWVAEGLEPAAAGAAGAAAVTGPPPELELRTLARTRRLLALQRWLFGFAISFTAVGLALDVSQPPGQPLDVHFLVFERPLGFGVPLLIGAACWVAYFSLRSKLKTRPR
jgi:anti-sigma factor RsiW